MSARRSSVSTQSAKKKHTRDSIDRSRACDTEAVDQHLRGQFGSGRHLSRWSYQAYNVVRQGARARSGS